MRRPTPTTDARTEARRAEERRLRERHEREQAATENARAREAFPEPTIGHPPGSPGAQQAQAALDRLAQEATPVPAGWSRAEPGPELRPAPAPEDPADHPAYLRGLVLLADGLAQIADLRQDPEALAQAERTIAWLRGAQK